MKCDQELPAPGHNAPTKSEETTPEYSVGDVPKVTTKDVQAFARE